MLRALILVDAICVCDVMALTGFDPVGDNLSLRGHFCFMTKLNTNRIATSIGAAGHYRGDLTPTMSCLQAIMYAIMLVANVAYAA